MPALSLKRSFHTSRTLLPAPSANSGPRRPASAASLRPSPDSWVNRPELRCPEYQAAGGRCHLPCSSSRPCGGSVVGRLACRWRRPLAARPVCCGARRVDHRAVRPSGRPLLAAARYPSLCSKNRPRVRAGRGRAHRDGSGGRRRPDPFAGGSALARQGLDLLRRRRPVRLCGGRPARRRSMTHGFPAIRWRGGLRILRRNVVFTLGNPEHASA